MSKAVQGLAMLGGAVALGAAASFDPALVATGLWEKALVSLVVGGIGDEIGAIADALTQNRSEGITTRQPAAYRGVVYGTRQVPGVMVYASTTGSSDDQYNMVIVLAGHPCYAIQNLYLDGRKVYWDVGSTGNTTQNGYNFGGSANGNSYIGPDGTHYNFGTLVYCEARYGTQALGDVIGGLTANDPTWATTSSGSPSLVGCTYVYLKVEYDTSMFPQFPEIRFTVSGNCNIYDPRTQTTGFSENWALCVADVLTNTDYGLAVPQSSINTAQLIAAANVCDEQVALAAGGTESRYTCNWCGDTSLTTGDILAQIFPAGGGDLARLSCVGGEWFIYPGYWQGSSFTFDDNSLVAPIQWTPNRSFRDLFNRVKGTYIAPFYPYAVAGNLYDSNGYYDGQTANTFNLGWQPTDYPYYAQDSLHGYASDEWLAQDGSRIIYKDLNHSACISVATSQRIAKMTLLRNRFQGSGTLSMMLDAYQMQPLDVMQFNFPLFGWDDETLEVTGLRLSTTTQNKQDTPGIGVEVDVQITDPSIYEWSTSEELNIYDVPITTVNPSYIVGPPSELSLDSSAATALTSLDGIVTPRVLVSWTAPEDAYVTQIQVEYQQTGASTWIDAGMVDVSLFQTYVSGVVAGQSYGFRIRSLRANGATSVWVEQDDYVISDTYSSILSTGLNPNSPYNINNDATINSIVDSSGSYADIEIYGPGGIGTAWDNYTGEGSATYPAATITGLQFSTTYYVTLDVSDGDYAAFTDYNDSLSDAYIPVGSITTVNDSGAGGTSGGGSGSGSGSGSPRAPVACTVEGTALDTPDGAIDNRVLKARFDAGEAVYLTGRSVPERIVGAEWVWVDSFERITVDGFSFDCSASHTLSVDGQHIHCGKIPSGSMIETRTGYVQMVRRTVEEGRRVLRIHLEGPSHEYSVGGILTHNTFKAVPPS